ncbi:MAG: M50 family metallopeptidase [Colwellia sp.]|nr:M50 family metallopeptidase [Colwellia sp.]
MPELQSTKAISFRQKYHFWLYLLAAFFILQIPIISVPFKWLESYFHEISHGLSALLTGGSIVQIQLFPNGAGLCTTRGGLNFVISFMGYAGAIFWGMIIYSIASVHHRLAQLFSGLVICLFIISLLFWVRDLLSFIIVTILLAIFIAQFKLPKSHYLQIALKLTGVLVLVNSLYSPWYLIDGRSIGDGAALAQLTLIPEFIWVLVWSVLGIVSLVVLAKKSSSTY